MFKVLHVIQTPDSQLISGALDTITLSFDQRHCRRIALKSDRGHEFLLDLHHAVLLKQDDCLQLEDGSWIKVQEADEPVLNIACEDASQLVRIAWHLGNRHCPTQILENGLRIPYDKVLEKMLVGLGAAVETHSLPFSPESGAYSTSHSHE